MISVREAQDKILASVLPLGVESRGLIDTLAYTLAEDVHSDMDVPPFDNSSMDGYAVVAADLAGASPERPAELEIIDDLPAGYVSKKSLSRGQAIRIMTGAVLPNGADGVVIIENTTQDGNRVRVLEPIKVGANIRRAGEDLKNDELILPTATMIRPPEMGVLASMGKAQVSVFARPRVALISTGDELTPLGEEVKAGKIRDSNRYALWGSVIEAGGYPIDLGIARDDAEILEAKFQEGLDKADVLITSAGVSVGDYDVVKDVLSKFGDINYWKVSMKPGKPQTFGMAGRKPIFGLPGNPVSAMIVFEIMVRPALLKMAGRTKLFRPQFKAILEENIKNYTGRDNYMRGHITTRDGRYYARSTGPQGSGILRSMVLANGLIIIPMAVKEVKAGDEVDVEIFAYPETREEPN